MLTSSVVVDVVVGNHISAGGVKALQEAVGYQTSLLNLNKSAPPGLMRLSLIVRS